MEEVMKVTLKSISDDRPRNYFKAVVVFSCDQDCNNVNTADLADMLQQELAKHYEQLRNFVGGAHPEWLNGNERIELKLDQAGFENWHTIQYLANVKFDAQGISAEWRNYYDSQMR